MRLDVNAVKQRAAGRWREILAALGDIDTSILDGKNHPCPRCGGTDRFRFIDGDAGALFCNRCFNKENGDGLAALQWVRGWDFQTALAEVSRYLGDEPVANGKPRIVKTYDYCDESGRLVGRYQAGGVDEAMDKPDKEHFDNGLAARLLFAMPPRRPKRWTEDELPWQTETALETLVGRLLALDMPEDENGQPQSRDIPLSPQGKQAWIEFYNAHACEQAGMAGELAAAGVAEDRSGPQRTDYGPEAYASKPAVPDQRGRS